MSHTTSRTGSLSLVLALVTLGAACSSESQQGFAPTDVASTKDADVATDTVEDATVDATIDARVDATVDARVDATVDVRVDSRVDATCDANLLTSNENCGACGVRCASGERCVAGRCSAGSECSGSCRTHDDCRPCSNPADPTGRYCCYSGLCLYTTEMMCRSETMVDPGPTVIEDPSPILEDPMTDAMVPDDTATSDMPPSDA